MSNDHELPELPLTVVSHKFGEGDSGLSAGGHGLVETSGVTAAERAAARARSTCKCTGNPTKKSCPVNNVYATIDPGVDSYDSLDCSVVVYEIQQRLHEIDDPQLAAEMEDKLRCCPDCDELVDIETKLRALVQNACAEKAPESLRESLFQSFHVPPADDDC